MNTLLFFASFKLRNEINIHGFVAVAYILKCFGQGNINTSYPHAVRLHSKANHTSPAIQSIIPLFIMKFSLGPTHLRTLVLFSVIPYLSAQTLSLPLSHSTTCDQQCQKNVQLGVTFEQDSHAHTPLDDFYSIPATFTPSMKPSTLLRVEAHTSLINYTVPGGLTMSRIMYSTYRIASSTVNFSSWATRYSLHEE